MSIIPQSTTQATSIDFLPFSPLQPQQKAEKLPKVLLGDWAIRRQLYHRTELDTWCMCITHKKTVQIL